RPSVEVVTGVEKWEDLERLAHEKKLRGLYLSGHPMQVYAELVTKLGAQPLAPLTREQAEVGGTRPVRVVGLVADVRRFPQRRVVTLDDGEGTLEVKVFDEVAERTPELLSPDRIVVVD